MGGLPSLTGVGGKGGAVEPAGKAESSCGLVYSTDGCPVCPACRDRGGQCVCKARAKAASAGATGDGIVRVSRETKGRGGKAVTLVKGLALDEAALVQRFTALAAHSGATGVQLRGDAGVPYGRVVQVRGAAQQAGIALGGDDVALLVAGLGRSRFMHPAAGRSHLPYPLFLNPDAIPLIVMWMPVASRGLPSPAR